MQIKLLLDENNSPTVARRLAVEDGLDACHIRDRGLLEASDRDQLRVVRRAIATVVAQALDMANQVAHIAQDGTVTFEEIPRSD